MEVPLLSQDEFFRHLNLRSVHASSAKYYRQALKERLRASSQSQSLAPPKRPHKETALQTKSPILSPVKWLTPRTRKKMFGRPKIRSEKRVLDFDNNLKVIGCCSTTNHKLLASLLTNCHVLRHPGTKCFNFKLNELTETPEGPSLLRKLYSCSRDCQILSKDAFCYVK